MPDVIRIIAPLIAEVAKARGYDIEYPERYATLLIRLTAPGTQFDTLVTNFRPSNELLEAHVRLIVRIFFDGIGPKGAGGKALALPPFYVFPPGVDIDAASE
jgi:hypothetical protein